MYVRQFADDVFLFFTNLELFLTTLVWFGKFLTVLFVTSSLQGPPNYSTYAGLHSNQILTVKVCYSKRTFPPSLVADLLQPCRLRSKALFFSFLFLLSFWDADELSSVLSHSSYFPLCRLSSAFPKIINYFCFCFFYYFFSFTFLFF